MKSGETRREEDDRRNFTRYPVRLRVLFQQGGLTLFLEAEADNISEGGVCIKTRRRPPDAGTEMSLLLQLPDGELMIPGVVRWTEVDELAGPGSPQTMGIEFLEMDEPTRTRLTSLIDGLEP